MWPSLMQQAALDGVNMIELYVFWNYHEMVEGQYDWTGRGNLTLFLDAIADAGLFANLRIGPYVCAEWDYGRYTDMAGVQRGYALPLVQTITGARRCSSGWASSSTRRATTLPTGAAHRAGADRERAGWWRHAVRAVERRYGQRLQRQRAVDYVQRSVGPTTPSTRATGTTVRASWRTTDRAVVY